MGREETDVLVVGAGPVGLSMAIALRRLGVRCVVVEKHTSTLDFPRGRGVTVRTMEIMRRWGLEEELVTAGLQRSSFAVFSGANLLAPEFDRFVLPDPGPSSVSPSQPLICDQEKMEVVLCRAAIGAGAEVRFGCNLTEFVNHGDSVTGVVVEHDSGREYSLGARWMVAADGIRSPTRERLGIRRQGAGIVGTSLSILIEAKLGDRVADRASALYRLGDVPGGALLAVDNDRSWLLIKGYDPVLEPPDSFTETRLRQIAGAAIGDEDVEFAVIGHRFWEPTALVCERYRDGRVFLAGDAAHVAAPLGGLGMNCGVADVDNLAWKLAGVISGWADEDLLETYGPERRPVAQLTAEASLGPARAPNPVEGVVLGAHYESAAISPDGTALPEVDDPIAEYRPAARPGDRAPHLWLDGDKTRSTLDLYGDGFALLTTPEGAAWLHAAEGGAAVPMRVHEISHPDWPRLYGIEPSGAVLVRPDCHVAWRALREPSQPTELDAALRRAVGAA